MLQNFTSIFSLLDLIAFSFFILSWIGYSYYSTNSASSLSTAIKAWRSHWSQAMLLRENRIVDSQVINGLVQNVTFFASTSILILAGLFASLSAIDDAIKLLNELPFGQALTHAAYELRLFTLIILFTYAFFKYGWAMKQHSYSAMVMASVPQPSFADTKSAQQQAALMAKLRKL